MVVREGIDDAPLAFAHRSKICECEMMMEEVEGRERLTFDSRFIFSRIRRIERHSVFSYGKQKPVKTTKKAQ